MAEQPVDLSAVDLAAGLVIAVRSVALDAAAEHDAAQVLDQRAEPALALPRGVLALLLVGDVAVDADHSAVCGLDLVGADPAVVDLALERGSRFAMPTQPFGDLVAQIADLHHRRLGLAPARILP